MDILTARTFLAAVETGSFVAAAQRINASPSAVTERIKQLEAALQVRLFERDRNGCRLTAAGRRFVDPADAIVRLWDDARTRVALPSRFTRSLRIGCQFALVPPLLFPIVERLRTGHDDVALHAKVGAPRDLTRALIDGDIDLAVVYEPVMPRGIWTEKVVDDHLVLVNARPDTPWPRNFARLDWGEAADGEIARRYGGVSAPGLRLELGAHAVTWLVEAGASGLVPERLAAGAFAEGLLHPVAAAPKIAFSPYICGRTADDRELGNAVVGMARELLG